MGCAAGKETDVESEENNIAKHSSAFYVQKSSKIGSLQLHQENTMSSGSKILVVLGSTRDGRWGLRVAKLVVDHLEKQGLQPTLIDPLEIDAPLVRQPLHFMPPDAQKAAPAWMHKLNDQIKEADGFVLVSAEYNSTAPPALTNLLDHFSPANYRHKPVSIATYTMGQFGGIRARVALLPFVSELGLVCLPSTVAIPTVQNAEIDEHGATNNEKILQGVDKICKEIDWYISAQKAHKQKTGGFPN